MQLKLSTIVTCLVVGVFPVSVMATPVPITSATAWVKVNGSFQSENTFFDVETYSLLQKWTPCNKDSNARCEYVKLESVPFDLNGKMTIVMNNYSSVMGGYVRCRATIDVPFATQNNLLVTPVTSYYAKWEIIDSNIINGPATCPATLFTMKVSALNNGINGYQFDINEN